MIDGTPVLDIKPYIPDYDSPHNRKSVEPRLHDLLSSSVSVNQKSETEALYNCKSKECSDEKMEGLLTECESADALVSSQAAPQFSPKKSITKILEDIKIYLNQSSSCQVGHDSEDKVSDPPKTELLESIVGHVSFEEKANSTIAGWIRAPPVGCLEVQFTPRAEKQLAEFLPSHLAGQSNFTVN